MQTMTKESVDWKAIGRELGRVPQDCYNKWKNILGSKMKKGRFTPQEDALIRQRMQEWGDKGQGVFASLEKEMGRSLFSLCQRWTCSLKKSV